MKKVVVSCWLLVVGAMLSAFAESAAFACATGASMRLDTRQGVRIAAKGASETIAYSPRWGSDGGRGATALPSCTVTVDGATLKTASEEGEVEWSPVATGAHTLTHTAGDVTYTAQFTVLGDDVAQHAGALAANETWGSNQVHLVTGDFTVPSGKTLTIERGAVVKFMTGTSFTVNGTCTAYGVIFTHVNDDSVGGDTLMDGDAAKPVMDGYKLTGNIYEDGATERRYETPQTLTSSISGTVRLKGHKVYLANSSITVNSGATLTLMPGVIIKFASGCSLTVNGTLDVQGTRAAPIVFTSQKDDDWGGDTNGDGEKTYAQAGDVDQIRVAGTAKFNYCQVLYNSSSENYGGLEAYGGTVNFDNSVIAHTKYECVNAHSSGTLIARNSVFWDSSLGFGYYGSGRVKAYNCVFADLTVGIRQSGKTLTNCVFYRCKSFTDQSGDGSTFKNCVFYNQQGFGAQSYAKVGSNGNIWGDPKFLDPDNGDFRIAADSPCIDAGDGTVAPEFDYWGQPRMDAKGKKATGVPDADGVCPDIGIYEFPGKATIPVADLAVLSVTAPASAVPGEEIALTYIVTNRGAAEAVGMVRDQIALKGADAALGGQTVAAGEIQQLYSLQVGAAATLTARVKCPAVKSGNWTVGVTVNAERDIFEQVTANNTGWAGEPTAVELAALAAGSTQVVTIPAKGSVGMAVSGMPQTGGAAVMTLPAGVTVAGAVGYVPETGRLDVMGVALADGRTAVLLPAVPEGETVYLTFENATETEVSFGVTALMTQEGLELAKPADVPVTKKGPNVETKLVLPSSVRDGRIYTAWVEYANVGDEEAELPVFTVSSSGGGATLAATAKEPYESTSLDLIGLAPSAPRGKLKPGEAGKVAFFFLSQGTVNIKLSVVTEKSTSVLNGFATIADYRAGMSAAATRLCLRGGAEPDFTAVLAQALNEKRGAGGAAVCGTLRHAVTKLPLEGYVMTLVDTNDMVAVAATKTDASGAFALATTEKGDYAVRVQDVQRHDPALVSLDNVDLTGSLLFAVPLSSVGGTLLAGDTALAATAVRVVLDNVATERVGDWTVQTDEAGRFSFGMVPDGNYVLAADGWEGYCPLATEVFLVTNGVACAKDLVYTERGGRVFGKGVVRDEGGTVTNGVVEFVDCASRTRYAAAFDLDGSFAFEGLPAGEYSVCADVPGYYPAFSETVSVAVGSSKGDVELAFVKTPVFTARHPVGMSSVTTAFELMVEATDLAWDFNGDGVTDSTQTTPSYTFDSVGEHDVTLTYTDTNGVRRVSVYPRCVMVVDEIEPTLQPNAVLLTDGCGVVTESVRSNSLVLVGAAVAGYAVGDVVGYAGTAQGGGYVMRICAKRQEGGVNRWVLDTEVAELKDLYKTYFFVSDFEFTAPQVEKMFNSALKGKALKAAVIGKPDTFVKEATWASVPISLSRDYEYFGGNASFSLSGQFVHNSKPIVGSYSEWVDSSGRRCRVMYKKDSYTLKLSPEVSLETDNLIGGKHLFSMPLPSFRSAPAFIPYGFGLTINASVDSTVDIDVTASGTLGFDFEVGACQSLECVEIDGVRKDDRMMDWGFTKTFGAHMSAKVGATVHLHAVCGAYLSWLNMIGCVGGGIKVGGKLGVEQNISFANVYDEETHGLGEWDSGLALTAELYACLSGSVGLFNLPAGKFARLDVDTPWKLAVTGNAQFERLDFDVTRIDEMAFFFKSADPKVKGEGLLGFLDGIPLGVQSRSWNFGDGIGGVGETLDHRYVKAGSYEVKLTENCAFPTTLVPLGGDTLFTKIRRKTVSTFDDQPPEPLTETCGSYITPAKSCDPNEMAGPLGAGDPETERFVKPGEWMDYTIYFENKAEADVPAQEVFVDAQLGEWLDWSTFEMGEVAFNNQNETVLAGLKNGMKTVAQNGASYKVQLSVAFDEKTGAAHWYFRSYDPSQSAFNYWPAAVDAGFLPPNDETHRGEGHITYRVKVRDDAPKGVKIDAAATIVFDQNEPILTDPSWWNTVGSATVDETSGRHAKLDLVDELGLEIPEDVDYAAGDKVTVKVEGLAKGLKLVTTQQKETSGKKAVTNVVYTIEGVPTEAVDFATRPMYARVTVTYKDKTKGDKGKVESLQPVGLSIVSPEPAVLTNGVLNEVYGPTDIAELWPAVADAKVNPKEWSFKGWPAGVKYNATAKDANWSYKDGKTTVKTTAAPYTVYGQPTKAGEYPIVATWKHKLADGKTTVSETFSAVLTVWGDDGKSEFRYTDQAYVATETKELDATWKSFSGLPTGIKYTAKLIAADAKKGTSEYPAFSLYGTPTKPGVFAVTATKADPNDAKKTVKETFLWKVAAADAPTFALDTGTAPVEDLKAQIVQGANQSFAITASEGAKVTVAGLPTGLKLVQDKTTKLYSVEGVASKPGECFVTFKTVLNGVTTVTTTAFAVKANPFVGTYHGYACACPAVGAAKRLAVAEVTVAAAGTVKLTYTEGKAKYTASVKSFDWDDATGTGTAEGLVLKVSSADKKLGYGDRRVSLTFEDCGVYLTAKLDIADANGSSLIPDDWDGRLYATVKETEVPLPASQTFVFRPEDGTDTNALATVSVAYDAKKATAAFSGKLYDGTAVKATVPVIRVYDEGLSYDYSFAPFLVIAKDGTVYCFNTFYCWDGGYVEWVAEHGEAIESVWADYADYTLGDAKFAELVPETGAFTFGWGSDAETVGADTESFAFAVTTDKKGNPAGVAIYDADPQEGEKPLATVTMKVGKATGAISVSFTSKKGDKAKYAAELVWRGTKLFAGHVTRTWKGLNSEKKSVNKTAYGTAIVK